MVSRVIASTSFTVHDHGSRRIKTGNHVSRETPLRPLIDGFHGDVIRLQSQTSEVLRILIYTRLKISRKYIFVQVSSPEACFISKIQQFEVPSFHSA